MGERMGGEGREGARGRDYTGRYAQCTCTSCWAQCTPCLHRCVQEASNAGVSSAGGDPTARRPNSHFIRDAQEEGRQRRQGGHLQHPEHASWLTAGMFEQNADMTCTAQKDGLHCAPSAHLVFTCPLIISTCHA